MKEGASSAAQVKKLSVKEGASSAAPTTAAHPEDNPGSDKSGSESEGEPGIYMYINYDNKTPY